MKSTLRPSRTKVRTPKATQKMPRRTDRLPAPVPERAARLPIIPEVEDDALARNPQAVADTFRDDRLLKDLQDNANRSDLSKHRREITATNEDHEDRDEDAEDDAGQLHTDQHRDPAATGDVPDITDADDR